MKKRLGSVMLACSLAVVTMAGCSGSNGSGGGTPSEPAAADAGTTADVTAASDMKTLKWAIWDINSIFYYQPLVDEFERRNPDIKIEMVDLGSAGTSDYITNLAIELSGGGTDFDLATMQSVPQYTTLYRKEYLQNWMTSW